MSTEIALLKIVENLPNSLKIELLHYAEYLITKSSTLQKAEEKKVEDVTVKKPLAGSMKGTFVLPLSEDFDDPLEEFEEYM
jgi:Protein of unknown function (DUF2281)